MASLLNPSGTTDTAPGQAAVSPVQVEPMDFAAGEPDLVVTDDTPSLISTGVRFSSMPATVSIQNLQMGGSSLSMMSSGVNGAAGAAGLEVRSGSNHLTQVLTGLHQSGELSTVLQQQPQLVQDLSAIAAGDVSADPESLRFQFAVEEPVTQPGPTKKHTPTVYREQDRFLPIANVARIMRNAIPKNGKVSKDAKECMQECVSEFISFITSEACDKCGQEKRKTVTGDDILYAMATLGFDNYLEPLRLYLQKYREFTRSEKMATVPSHTASTFAQGLSASHSRTSVSLSETASSESLQQTSSGFNTGATTPQLTPAFSSYEHL